MPINEATVVLFANYLTLLIEQGPKLTYSHVTVTNTVTQVAVAHLLFPQYMDDRNNRPIPQDRQNLELTNAVPAPLRRFVQDGVTPDQFAENARQLETYSRMNAMGLQVYLQRQAEQRRKDE